MAVIDAHQHFWNLSRVSYPWLGPEWGPINRTIEAPELEPWLKKCGITKTVLVQAADSNEDTEYMLEVAQQYAWIGAVVGWVPLMDPEEAGKRLEQLVKVPVFKGVRHLIHDEPNPDWLIQDVVIEGLKVVAAFNVSFDVVAVFPNHLKHVPTIAERVPNLRMVIDHLGKPPIRERQLEPWLSQLKRAAEYPQVYAKISGLNTAADWNAWDADELRPYIDVALEVFGANRLMFGSDWPVANLAGNYETVWTETHKVLNRYDPTERAAILAGTAATFYHINLEED